MKSTMPTIAPTGKKKGIMIRAMIWIKQPAPKLSDFVRVLE
ncbi:MAG: hypothetical protein NT154_06705 [Verrucomicrobia bacterium]|nr:hypothetical protein [Verrucomicrobiota bacterium]